MASIFCLAPQIFCLTRTVLEGRWPGQPFFTLGWPDIKGVVTGDPEEDHPCPSFYRAMNVRHVYAPEEEDFDKIIKEFTDFSKPFIWRAIPERLGPLVDRLAKAKGQTVNKNIVNLFHAHPGDVPLKPVPETYRVRPIKNTPSDIGHCVDTWMSFPKNQDYIRGVISRLPSVCVVDEHDTCISFECGLEYGSVGLLHTREEHRGNGLAKTVISHLAEEYRKLNQDIYVCIILGNEISYRLHESMGFKLIDGKFIFFYIKPKQELSKTG